MCSPLSHLLESRLWECILELVAEIQAIKGCACWVFEVKSATRWHIHKNLPFSTQIFYEYVNFNITILGKKDPILLKGKAKLLPSRAAFKLSSNLFFCTPLGHWLHHASHLHDNWYSFLVANQKILYHDKGSMWWCHLQGPPFFTCSNTLTPYRLLYQYRKIYKYKSSKPYPFKQQSVLTVCICHLPTSHILLFFISVSSLTFYN